MSVDSIPGVFTPGIYPGIRSEAYHADPALGSTSLKTLATKTPAHYQWGLTHPKTSDAFDLGTVAHSIILEGDSSGVRIIEADDKRGLKWTVPAGEARKAGQIPLLAKEFAVVNGMRNSVMDHAVASKLFTGHRAEDSVFWDEDGSMFKCRPDAWKPDMLVDLKTTVNADPREFGKTAYNFGYHQSAAHYIDGVQKATGEMLPFTFVLVEKTAPYLVSVVTLDEVAVEMGRALNKRAKRIHAECSASGNWPGYPTAEPIHLPMWANYEMDELLGIDNEVRF